MCTNLEQQVYHRGLFAGLGKRQTVNNNHPKEVHHKFAGRVLRQGGCNKLAQVRMRVTTRQVNNATCQMEKYNITCQKNVISSKIDCSKMTSVKKHQFLMVMSCTFTPT